MEIASLSGGDCDTPKFSLTSNKSLIGLYLSGGLGHSHGLRQEFDWFIFEFFGHMCNLG